MSRLGNMSLADGSKPAISRPATVNWIMLIYFVSGACSLIDEVIWVRLLKLTLGNTVYATSIVVSVFMGGLALGALIMSRYSDRVTRRLRLYSLLEILVTISALSLPFALKFVDGIYVWFYRAYHPSHAQLLIVQVVISAAILLVPSMLMGSTLPLLGRFVTSLERQAGHLVGKLYALNTLGAAAGCFLAGFVFIRLFGVMGTLYIAAVLNLLVAFGGWFLSHYSGVTAEGQAEAAAPQSAEAAEAKTADGKFYLLILAFFMSGLISIGYELLWMRSVVHLLNGYTYVFSAVLTVYLLGNVIGAGIGSALVSKLKNPAVWFATTLFVLGLFGFLYLPLLILWSSKVMSYVNQQVELLGTYIPFSPYMIKPLLQSVFLFLVPAIIMGIGFPIALQAWANHMHKVGRSTGTAYGANTIGAVIGGIATGFVLIPLLGVQISISILGLVGIWIAAVMWLLFVQRSRVVVRWGLLGIAVFITILTVKMPSDMFNTVVKMNPALPEGFELLAMEEGVTTTISVHTDKDDALRLYSSGQSVAGDNYVERGDQKMLGHFGVLLNKGAKRVLSVGFGSGETTACLALHKLEAVDCVEIAPEIVDVALKFFSHINLADKLDEEINMIYMDAKNYIHLTDSKYDVIVNDSIHPRDFAENASLYGKEYFESAREHLNHNGMIISWLPTYRMPTSVFNSIIGTLLDVFPHVTVWYLTPHPAPLVLVAGSKQPQYFSPSYIEKRLMNESIQDSLSAINVYNSMDVMSCYIGDEDDLRKFIKEYSVNSDYWPFVEFNTDAWTPRWQIFRKFVTNVRSDTVYEHIDWTGLSKEEKEKWLADYQQLYKASSYLLMANGSNNWLDRLKYCMDGLSVLPDSPALLDTRARAEEKFLSIGVNMILSGKTDNALLVSSDILKIYPQSAIAWIIRSEAMQNKGDMSRALASARHAVKLDPDNAIARFNLGDMLFKVSEFAQAIAEYRQALESARRTHKLNTDNQIKALEALAAAYAAAGWLPDAIAAAEKAFDLASSTGRKEMAEHVWNRLLSFKATCTDR